MPRHQDKLLNKSEPISQPDPPYIYDCLPQINHSILAIFVTLSALNHSMLPIFATLSALNHSRDPMFVTDPPFICDTVCFKSQQGRSQRVGVTESGGSQRVGGTESGGMAQESHTMC